MSSQRKVRTVETKLGGKGEVEMGIPLSRVNVEKVLSIHPRHLTEERRCSPVVGEIATRGEERRKSLVVSAYL